MLNLNFFGTVKKLKIFEGIDEGIVENILSQAQREEFGVGKIIIEQGEHPDGKGYIIEHGSVDVWVNGKQTAVLSTGDIFGEIALLNEEPRTASIITKEPTNLIILSQDTLFTMIENDDNTINKEIMRRIEANLENE